MKHSGALFIEQRADRGAARRLAMVGGAQSSANMFSPLQHFDEYVAGVVGAV